ncbi:MAG: pyridoxamine 5'-phosphate oxidase family protein [Gammaproteobacteria bacterium]
MSAAEIRAFLAGVEWVAIGTLDASGAPHADAAAALLAGERLWFAVASASPAAAHLDRDPRVCCAADVFPSYYEIKGVTVHGRARRADPGEAARVRAELAARAGRQELAADEIWWVPALEDGFGFDFARIAARG